MWNVHGPMTHTVNKWTYSTITSTTHFTWPTVSRWSSIAHLCRDSAWPRPVSAARWCGAGTGRCESSSPWCAFHPFQHLTVLNNTNEQWQLHQWVWYLAKSRTAGGAFLADLQGQLALVVRCHFAKPGQTPSAAISALSADSHDRSYRPILDLSAAREWRNLSEPRGNFR